jgi:hypothetical protein
MSSDVEFYNKYMQVLKKRLDGFINESLSLETQLAIAQEKLIALQEENGKLETKVKSFEKKTEKK